MKKRAFKVTVVAGLMTLMVVGFAGCKKTECEMCGEVARCKTYEAMDEEMEICGDCMEEMEELANEIKDLFE